MKQAHKDLERSIEEQFDRFDSAKKKYEVTRTLDDYIDCVTLLPHIADLVTCLKIESLKAEGKFPLN
tara:strand:- start:11532 stop:11732 length:201 start_codon:yes stop_codon:yes gene_type:complete